jgi:hypothetical protein
MNHLSASTTQSGTNSAQSDPLKQALHSQMGLPIPAPKLSKNALPWPEQDIDATFSASSAANFVHLCSHPPPKYKLIIKTLSVIEQIRKNVKVMLRTLVI